MDEMDEYKDTLLRTCRTCLKNNVKTVSLFKLTNNARPRRTYGQLLKEYAAFEFTTEQEARMPQGLCVMCCRQLRTIYKFVCHAQSCNDKLMIMATDNHHQSDCLNEEAIDLPHEEEDENMFDLKHEYDPSEDRISDDSVLLSNDSLEENTTVAEDESHPSTSTYKHDTSDTSDQMKKPAKLDVPCPICSKLFKRDYVLKHLRKLHGINHPSIFLKKQQYVLKTDDVDFEKVFQCSQCDYIARSKAGINYHNRTKHITEDDKFKCKFCSFAYVKKCNLVKHIKSEHKLKFKALKHNVEKRQNIGDASTDSGSGDSCDDTSNAIAEADSSDDDEFIRDMINVDWNILKANFVDGKSYSSWARKCDECGNVYKDFPSLYAHKRFVHISEDMYSVCVHCGKKYKRNKDLRNHISQVHAAEEPSEPPEVPEKRYRCSECPYATTTTTHLKLHIRRHHTGEKPYICEICGNSFLTSYDLKKHSYLHTGEKPHKCPMCPKTFRVSSKLTKHKRVHTGERPFKCAVCGKGFAQEYNLSVHKRTHMREQNTVLPVKW